MSFLAFRAALRARPPRLALSRAYHPLGPLSWREKIWYRPDGSRRSKIKGVIYVTVLSSALIMHGAARFLENSQPPYVFVAKLQLIDSKHPIDESSTPSDVATYVVALKDVYPLIADVQADQVPLMALAHRAASRLSPEYHENVRKALHDIHKIFATGDKPFTEETTVEVLESFTKFQLEMAKMGDVFAEAEKRLGSDKLKEELSKAPDKLTEAEILAIEKLRPDGKNPDQDTAANGPPEPSPPTPPSLSSRTPSSSDASSQSK